MNSYIFVFKQVLVLLCRAKSKISICKTMYQISWILHRLLLSLPLKKKNKKKEEHMLETHFKAF